MPIRGLKPTEKPALNIMLEASYRGARFDHRFIRLHKQKPLMWEWNRIYEYDPTQEHELPLNSPAIIAHCGIWPQPMQFGHTIIMDGGVRDVASHPIARGKGYGLQVMEEAKEFMKTHDVDISVLFSGADHFYEKLGWTHAGAYSHYLMNQDHFTKFLTDDSIKKQNFPLITIRSFQPSDIASINQLYQETNPGHYFAAHRTPEYWQNHLITQGRKFKRYLLAFQEEQVIAYLFFNYHSPKKAGFPRKMQLHISEFRISSQIEIQDTCMSEYILQSFLKHIAQYHSPLLSKIHEVYLNVSSNFSPVKQLLEQGLLESDGKVYPGAMILITNPIGLFTKLEPEFQDRVQKGLLPQGTFAFNFSDEEPALGGVIMDTEANQFILQVIDNPEDFETKSAEISDRAYFATLKPLIRVMSMPQAIEKAVDDLELRLEGAAASWLNGLFSGISWDLYELDHF